MKKKWVCVWIVFLILLLLPAAAFASTELEVLEEQTTQDALENAPDSVRAYYGDGEKTTLGFAELWGIVRDELGEARTALRTPLTVFGLVTTVCLLYSLLTNMGQSRAVEQNVAVKACVCAAVALSVSTGIVGLMQSTLAALETGRSFVLGFVPVFTGIMISGGSVTSAALYGSALIGLSTVISETAALIIKPLVGVMAGLSVVSGMYDNGFLSLVTAIKKTVLWILGVSTTVFLSLVKLQSIAAARTDSFAFRTSRFLVSSAIPVIGASANEALSTVGGGLAVIRSTTGVIGVASVCAIFLPPLIHCVLCGVSLYFASIVGEFTGAAEPARAVRSIKSCIDVLVSVLALYFMVVVTCTAVMMNVGVGQ